MTTTPSTSDYIGAEPEPMIKVTGPVLVRFHSAERAGISAESRYFDVYIDVTKILVLKERSEGSRIILEGNAIVDLAETCDEVLETLRKVMEGSRWGV